MLLAEIQRLCFSLLALRARASTRPLGERLTFLTAGILPFAATRPASLFAPLLRRSARAKKGKQRNTPQNIAPFGHPVRRVRDNGRVPLTAHPVQQRNARDPSRAPALRAGLIRPPFAASQRDPRSRARAKAASAAGTAALCSSRVPSQPRQARGGKSPKGGPQDAGQFAVCTRTYCQRTSVARLRSLPGMDARQTAAARVPFSLVTFSCTSKRK